MRTMRPVRLLGSEKMGALGGEYVGPPVPSGDEQKNRKKNRVRGKKERDFAVGEARGPGDLRRDIILNGAGEDTAQRAEKCLRVRWFGLDPRPEFGISAIVQAVHRLSVPGCVPRRRIERCQRKVGL
jgi:hypothetical protein